MSDLYQDITVTLNLSELTPKKYHAILRKLNSLSIGALVISSYDPEYYLCNGLSKEHMELLNKLKK